LDRAALRFTHPLKEMSTKRRNNVSGEYRVADA
jgi:hypothetical protein